MYNSTSCVFVSSAKVRSNDDAIHVIGVAGKVDRSRWSSIISMVIGRTTRWPTFGFSARTAMRLLRRTVEGIFRGASNISLRGLIMRLDARVVKLVYTGVLKNPAANAECPV